jgi:YidC/Oxa1 family membrane protein insertase
MQKIQKKYKGKTDPESRQAMTQETMGLYKRTGTNPFSSCLPILLQSPVFFALFRVLQSLPNIADGKKPPIGPLDAVLAAQAENSTIFGARLSDYFMEAGGNLDIQIVTVVLIVLMSATTFTTQRQLMMKNMPANALDNPFAKQQKILLYLMPVFFAFSGINFPIGVLLYWLTTNLWSMGQQFYTIRRMPAPGSPAEKALEARRMKSGKEHKKFTIPGLSHDTETEDIQDEAADAKPKSGQRQQPKRKKRAKPPVQADSPGSGGSGSQGDGSLNGSTGNGPQDAIPTTSPVDDQPAPNPAATKNGKSVKPAATPNNKPAKTAAKIEGTRGGKRTAKPEAKPPAHTPGSTGS